MRRGKGVAHGGKFALSGWWERPITWGHLVAAISFMLGGWFGHLLFKALGLS